MLTHARWFVAAGVVGMQSGGADGWQESGRAEMAMHARTPVGGRRPARWSFVVGMPVGLELRGARGMQL